MMLPDPARELCKAEPLGSSRPGALAELALRILLAQELCVDAEDSTLGAAERELAEDATTPGGSGGTSPRSATRPRRARGPRRPHREAGHAPCRAQRQEKRGAGDPLQQLGNSTRAAALSRGRGLGAQPCVAATAPAAPAGGRSRLRGSVAFVSSSVRALLCPAGRRGTETAEAGPHETRRAKSR